MKTKPEVHKKLWGEEHWIVNKSYCGKKLILKKGYCCSVHYHILKDEVFYIATGLVLMEIEDIKEVMRPGDSVHISQGVSHRFTGLEKSEIFEFSTFHSDDDSYRGERSCKVSDKKFKQLIENLKIK